MKIFYTPFAAVLLCLCFSGILSSSIAAQAPAAAAIKLFNGRDGTGMEQDVPPGSYAVSGKQIATAGKDPGISVRVPKDLKVRFCEDKGSGDGGGKCEEFGEGVHNVVSLGFNFIRVWQTSARPAVSPIMVFESLNWGGRSQVFGPGMYRSFRAEFGKINDNQAMSVIISKGFQARFCSDEGVSYRGSGNCETHGEGRHNLRLADSISFIEVKDLSDQSPDDEKMPVILYEDGAQVGIMQGFDAGEFLGSGGQLGKIGNDRASSISVKNGYRAQVCADEPGPQGAAGSCEEFESGKRNIKSKKTASYLRVWKVEK